MILSEESYHNLMENIYVMGELRLADKRYWLVSGACMFIDLLFLITPVPISSNQFNII